jgi:hypothetical protein
MIHPHPKLLEEYIGDREAFHVLDLIDRTQQSCGAFGRPVSCNSHVLCVVNSVSLGIVFFLQYPEASANNRQPTMHDFNAEVHTQPINHR